MIRFFLLLIFFISSLPVIVNNVGQVLPDKNIKNKALY